MAFANGLPNPLASRLLLSTVRAVYECLPYTKSDGRLVMPADEAPERPEALAGLSHLLAQRVGPAIGLSGFVSCHALGNHQQLSQHEL